MNKYHMNHPDPEIREKYWSWRDAYNGYLARSRGCNSVDQMKTMQQTEKQQRSLRSLLAGSITRGSNVQRRTTKQTQKRQLRTAQRGG